MFVSLVVGMVGSLGYPTPNPQDYSLQSITDTPNMISSQLFLMKLMNLIHGHMISFTNRLFTLVL